MTISIRQAFSNVASDKYDKGNMFIFFLILLISFIINIIFYNPSDVPKLDAKTIIVSLLTFIFCFLCFGIYWVAINNAIKKKNKIFPNLFSDFKYITIVCFRSLLLIPSCIIAGLPYIFFGVLMGVFSSINSFISIIFSIITIVAFVFYIIIIVGLQLIFAKSLNWKDMFAYKKAYKFIMKTGKSGGSWFLRANVFLPVIIWVLSFVILLIIFIITGAIVNPVVMKSTALGLIIYFVFSAVICIHFALYIDLTSQLFDELREKKILKPLKTKT